MFSFLFFFFLSRGFVEFEGPRTTVYYWHWAFHVTNLIWLAVPSNILIFYSLLFSTISIHDTNRWKKLFCNATKPLYQYRLQVIVMTIDTSSTMHHIMILNTKKCRQKKKKKKKNRTARPVLAVSGIYSLHGNRQGIFTPRPAG